ncbi:hypothetical protein WME76_36845 [Sorangium sp. So ce119]|uniref:hypothetical protein n=1 Tax=Sorangium sp. So ce119 TaxID=3133279 RepID=UPI003F5F9980
MKETPMLRNRFSVLNRWAVGMMISSSVGLASLPALAESYGAVKVECWGDCTLVNLGQICDRFVVGSIPVAVACDDTASPGSGTAAICGGGATCTSYGTAARGDALSAYCADGGGNDAVITCRAP